MWRRWGAEGWGGETPWGPRLILAAATKLISKKTEECNTGRGIGGVVPKMEVVESKQVLHCWDIWYWPTTL